MKKKSAKAAANDNQIEAALKDLRAKVYKSVNAAAKAHGGPEPTLRARKKGRTSSSEANETKQILSAAEEKALVQWILEVSSAGYPPRKSQVREMAEPLHVENTILKTRLKAATDVLAARQQQKKGTRIALKDQLLLTTDEVIGAVQRAREEKKKRVKKPAKRGRKRKAQDMRVRQRTVQAI